MITIISGTNRATNNSIIIAEKYAQTLQNMGVKSQILDLRKLAPAFLFDETYGNRTNDFEDLLTKFIYNVDKIVFVTPEYNGSFSGVLKSFIDTWEPKRVISKKAALVGLAAGRAGNLRGMDHMTNILHYLQFDVMFYKIPISKIYDLLVDNQLTDEDTILEIEKQMERFLDY